MALRFEYWILLFHLVLLMSGHTNGVRDVVYKHRRGVTAYEDGNIGKETNQQPYITSYGNLGEVNRPYITQYGDVKTIEDPYITSYIKGEETEHLYVTAYGKVKETELPYITAYKKVKDTEHPYITAYGKSKETEHPYITTYEKAKETKYPYITAYGKGKETEHPYITAYGKGKKTEHPYITAYRKDKQTHDPYITSYGKGKEIEYPYVTNYENTKENEHPYITSYGNTKENEHPYVTSYGNTEKMKRSYETEYTEVKEMKDHIHVHSASQNGGHSEEFAMGVMTQPSSHNDHTEAFKIGFFIPDDLCVGKIMPLNFPIEHHSRFLPKEVVESIPFSKSQLPHVLQLFSIPGGSSEAKAMEETIRECSLKPIDEEIKLCATSLESMVEFAREIIGSGVDFNILSTTHPTMSKALTQNYTILEEPKQVVAPKMVSCHPMPYPYAIFFCHYFGTETKVFKVSLDGENGDNVEAVAVCHMDSSKWDPDHILFRLLGTKPGVDSPVCHFLPANHLVWAPSPKTATF